jgi:uncharacterized protein YecE (DUF72 family)
MKSKSIHIGTSGWYYEHWDKIFYQEIPIKERLSCYAEHFSTVELNTTFYHLPKVDTITHWYDETPKNFIFAVKVSRYVTHIKKLHETQKSINLFIKRIASLKQKLGPILFQLPYSFTRNDDRLEACIAHLPKKHTYVFEFRNNSWLVDDVFDLLRAYNIGFCISDFNKTLTPLEVTADYAYVRLHGPKGRYRGSYTDEQLRNWACRIKQWHTHKIPVFFFFNNDERGFAVQNAQRLQEIILKMK